MLCYFWKSVCFAVSIMYFCLYNVTLCRSVTTSEPIHIPVPCFLRVLHNDLSFVKQNIHIICNKVILEKKVHLYMTNFWYILNNNKIADKFVTWNTNLRNLTNLRNRKILRNLLFKSFYENPKL